MPDEIALHPLTRLRSRFTIFLWSSCVFIGNPTSYAVESLTMNASKLASLKPTMQSWIDGNTLPNVAVLVMHHGDIVFQHQAGLLDLELQTPVQSDSLYRIYSMTKPIAAVAAMMLVEQSKLSLDEPISQILPEFAALEVLADEDRVPARPMTLRHLLSHSSGLSYGYYGDTAVDKMYRAAGLIDDWDYLVPTTHELVVQLGKLPLLFQPGERFRYSFASDVVAEVVARTSGKPFDDFLQRALWEPLGIADAYFDVPDSELSRFGTNQFPFHEGQFSIQDTPRTDPEFRNVTFLSGGGGLVMSIQDFGKFAQFLLRPTPRDGRSLLSESTLAEMFTNQLDTDAEGFQYGLGFGIRIRPDALDSTRKIQTYYWGGAAGTMFWVDPEYNLVAVFFTQLIGAPSEPASVFSAAVYDALETLSTAD